MHPAKINVTALGIAAVLLVGSSCARQQSYSTYEDCILAKVSGPQTSAAVAVIQDACRSKFPPSATEISALRQSADRVAKDTEAAVDAANAAVAAADSALKANERR